MPSHQPQVPRAVHAPQSVEELHASHWELVQSQSEQLPEEGPPEVPVAHAPVDAHQPQLDLPVHAPQSDDVAQGSEVPPQDDENQSQSEQLPVVGPPEVPVRQVLDDAHQPQVPRAVHPPQSLELEQASVLSQAKVYQSQSEQVPEAGPPKEPDEHMSVLSHQPHPVRPRHPGQVRPPVQSVPVEQSELTQSQSEQLPLVGPEEPPV